MNRKGKHVLDRDGAELYVVLDDHVLEWIARIKERHGTWSRVYDVTGTREDTMMRIRTKRSKALSLSLVDRMIVGSGVGHLGEFVWHEADDLVTLGIWKPQVDLRGLVLTPAERVARRKEKAGERRRRRAREWRAKKAAWRRERGA